MRSRGSQTPLSRPGRFPKAARLTHKREFDAVYLNKLRKSAHPFVIFFLANDLATPRLGLAVHGRVGTAVFRNTIKRRLREAFRQILPQLQYKNRGIDLVVQVRSINEAPSVVECESALRSAAAAAWREIEKRERRGEKASNE